MHSLIMMTVLSIQKPQQTEETEEAKGMTHKEQEGVQFKEGDSEVISKQTGLTAGSRG